MFLYHSRKRFVALVINVFCLTALLFVEGFFVSSAIEGAPPVSQRSAAGPDLSVTVSNGRTSVQPSLNTTYNINYANNAGSDATGVVLSVTIPFTGTFTGSGWTCLADGDAGLTCLRNIGDLPSGASGSVTFPARANDAQPASLLIFTGKVSISDDGTHGTDFDPANNIAMDTDQMRNVWLGGTSADWSTASNWSHSVVPAVGDNVSIPGGSGGGPHSPSISGPLPEVIVSRIALVGKNLVINAGRVLSVNSLIALGPNIVSGEGLLELSVDATSTRTTGQIETALKRTFIGAGSRTFMVGTPGEYSPVDVQVQSGFLESVTVKAKKGVAPLSPAPLNPAATLNRYWSIEGSGGTFTANTLFHYLQGDVRGNETNYRVVRVSNGTSATYFPPSGNIFVTPANDTFTVNGLSEFSDWSAGDPLNSVSRTPFDFDGDGKTDLSVYRPTDTPGDPDFSVRNSSNNSVGNTAWGSAGDRAAVADFDGDGKSDIAVFRPSEGNWYALSSSNGTLIAVHFGVSEDKPVPADYDGDGRADIAVFRPSEGNWYMLRSSDSQFSAMHFGSMGDLPVQDNYDADGKADLAVFRPSDGAWYILGSTQGFFAQHFGLNGDRPVAGDLDADGRADFTVFRPSDRTWYSLRSNLGFTAVTFGLSTDTPLQADLDGDGKRDIAVYRASGNSWFYLRSSDGGFASGNFGAAGDTPLPSIYVGP